MKDRFQTGILGGDYVKKIMDLLRNIITKYDMKHPEYIEPVFICPNIDTRNRCKNEKYKISEDQPQCPIYEDNRCCGGCHFAATCEHCVDCNCFGFTYAQMGGTDKQYYMHKASQYYDLGRIDKNGKFDWDYYKKNLRRKEIVPGKYICIYKRVYKINSKTNSRGNFTAISCESNKHKRFNADKLGEYIHVYNNLYSAKLFNN